jgi:hypothetical protein
MGRTRGWEDGSVRVSGGREGLEDRERPGRYGGREDALVHGNEYIHSANWCEDWV